MKNLKRLKKSKKAIKSLRKNLKKLLKSIGIMKDNTPDFSPYGHLDIIQELIDKLEEEFQETITKPQDPVEAIPPEDYVGSNGGPTSGSNIGGNRIM